MKHKNARPSTNRRIKRELDYHQRKRSLHVHLSDELREKHETRSIPVRKGDTVLITHGKYKATQNKISRVSLKKQRVQIEGVKTTKTDGTEIFHFIEPSNLVITKLGTTDENRLKLIERKKSSIEEKEE